MGTAWERDGWPDDCYRNPALRAYQPRHAAPPGFFRVLLRRGDPPGARVPAPTRPPRPRPIPAPAGAAGHGELAPRGLEPAAARPDSFGAWAQDARPAPPSGAEQCVSFDWASWVRRRWDLMPRQG
jgi:hypothetical protein